MIQKISKCEVKVYNTNIHLLLNFAWNQFCQNLNLKNCHFYKVRGYEFWILVMLGLEKCLKFTEIKIQNL